MRTAEKWAKALRIVTVAPFLALLTLLLLWLTRPEVFRGPGDLLMAAVFLTGLPLLAYPLQHWIPKLRAGGRETQRKLAIVLAVAGYLGGAVWAYAAKASDWLRTLLLTYLISGLLIAIFNKVLHIRASGHACGTSGPVLYLTCLLGWRAAPGLLLMPAVWWSAQKLGRHTCPQLLWGSAISAAALVLARWICGV